jgi:hypothetical protein
MNSEDAEYCMIKNEINECSELEENLFGVDDFVKVNSILCDWNNEQGCRTMECEDLENDECGENDKNFVEINGNNCFLNGGNCIPVDTILKCSDIKSNP